MNKHRSLLLVATIAALFTGCASQSVHSTPQVAPTSPSVSNTPPPKSVTFVGSNGGPWRVDSELSPPMSASEKAALESKVNPPATGQ